MSRRKTRSDPRPRARTWRLLAFLAVTLALYWLSSSPQHWDWYVRRLSPPPPVAVRPSADVAARPDPRRPLRELGPAAPRLVRDLEPLPPMLRRLAGHSGGLGSPCGAGASVNPSRSARREVYRWTDADGQVHFADRVPAGRDVEAVGHTSGAGVDAFSIDYRYLGGEAPAAFGATLHSHIAGVLRVIGRELGLAGAQPLHVNLRVIEDPAEFAAYSERFAPGLGSMGGFYSFRGNEAVVRWGGPAETLAAARHEIAHLALGNWIGLTPLWLNEGLAQVVERLEFRQSFARAEAPYA